MNLLYAGCCRQGQVRRNNEDAFLMRGSERGALFLVADGIGGRRNGEVVSGLLRDGYDRWWTERFLPAGDGLSFQAALREIQDVLLRVNQEAVSRFGQGEAGSTLVLLFLYRGNCLYLSAGDSRIYLARNLSFRQITVDDVYENLAARDQRQGKSANGKLVGAVGLRLTPEFSIRTDALKRGDRFFLCSDGVYRYVPPRKLSRTVMFDPSAPEKLIETVSREVDRGGAGDNYSMIYVRVKSL